MSPDHGDLYDESLGVPPQPSIDTFRRAPILKLSKPFLHG